jgi:hypothetical protein
MFCHATLLSPRQGFLTPLHASEATHPVERHPHGTAARVLREQARETAIFMPRPQATARLSSSVTLRTMCEAFPLPARVG